MSKIFQGITSSKADDTSKAIFAIREVFQEHVYQTRGIACAVNIRGSIRLVTWRGVIGEADKSAKIYMDRFAEKFSDNIPRYRLKMSTIKENGNFSYISVDSGCDETGETPKFTTLNLEILNDVKSLNFVAHSFSGKDPVKLNFEYDEGKKRHTLMTGEWKTHILEKSTVVGSPIVVHKDKCEVVVGLVGVTDGELGPCFFTEEELCQYKDPSEGGVGEEVIQHQNSCFTDATDTFVPPAQPYTEETSQDESKHVIVSNLVRSGKFRREDLPYLALDIQAKIKWKTIGKSLELTEAELNGIKTDNSEDYERCYEMLKIWCQRGDASYKVLADVLEEHRLQDIRENYCLVGYDPPLQETVAQVQNVKEGKVIDKDIPKIARAVQEKRKRLGRALGVTDSELNQIGAKDPDDILEQSFQVLYKWKTTKGRDATYNALAKALCNRTVNMESVVAEFCLT